MNSRRGFLGRLVGVLGGGLLASKLPREVVASAVPSPLIKPAAICDPPLGEGYLGCGVDIRPITNDGVITGFNIINQGYGYNEIPVGAENIISPHMSEEDVAKYFPK